MAESNTIEYAVTVRPHQIAGELYDDTKLDVYFSVTLDVNAAYYDQFFPDNYMLESQSNAQKGDGALACAAFNQTLLNDIPRLNTSKPLVTGTQRMVCAPEEVYPKIVEAINQFDTHFNQTYLPEILQPLAAGKTLNKTVGYKTANGTVVGEGPAYLAQTDTGRDADFSARCLPSASKASAFIQVLLPKLKGLSPCQNATGVGAWANNAFGYHYQTENGTQIEFKVEASALQLSSQVKYNSMAMEKCFRALVDDLQSKIPQAAAAFTTTASLASLKGSSLFSGTKPMLEGKIDCTPFLPANCSNDDAQTDQAKYNTLVGIIVGLSLGGGGGLCGCLVYCAASLFLLSCCIRACKAALRGRNKTVYHSLNNETDNEQPTTYQQPTLPADSDNAPQPFVSQDELNKQIATLGKK